MKRLLAAGLLLTIAISTVGCGKKASKVITNKDDLKSAKVGVQTGTTGDLTATDDYGDQCVERFKSGMEAVQSLKQGKIDAVIIDNEPAKIFVEQNSDLKILDDEYLVEDYAICLAKGNTELAEEINSAIAILKADGTFKAIEDYYITKAEGAAPYVKKDVERNNGKLIMATNAEFEPYEYREKDEIVGLDVDMAYAICDILGKELVIEDMSFDSIIAAVTTGKADVGVAGMTVTEDRLNSVDFTDSYYTGRQVIIVKK
ncbi:MAG: transporter substrate-binding domain-containing protein [Clostridiales bacterium]|nr:transporter substrate-binding domain-containing protein [Clostridiales bacterium]